MSQLTYNFISGRSEVFISYRRPSSKAAHSLLSEKISFSLELLLRDSKTELSVRLNKPSVSSFKAAVLSRPAATGSFSAPNFGNLSRPAATGSFSAPNFGNLLNLPTSEKAGLSTIPYASPIKVIHSGEVPLRKGFAHYSRAFRHFRRAGIPLTPSPRISGYRPPHAGSGAVYVPFPPAVTRMRSGAYAA